MLHHDVETGHRLARRIRLVVPDRLERVPDIALVDLLDRDAAQFR